MSLSNLIEVITIIALPIILGYSVLLILSRKQLPILLSLALSYGLGTGLLTQWMLLLGIIKIPFSIQTINYPLILITLVLLIIVNKSSKKNPLLKYARPKRDKFDFLLL